jgi:hypothetical protein
VPENGYKVACDEIALSRVLKTCAKICPVLIVGMIALHFPSLSLTTLPKHRNGLYQNRSQSEYELIRKHRHFWKSSGFHGRETWASRAQCRSASHYQELQKTTKLLSAKFNRMVSIKREPMEQFVNTKLNSQKAL